MSQPRITTRDLYPHLSEEELAEADENLDRYIELVLRIYERLEAEGQLPLKMESMEK
ncbi:MAG: hypothetical protein V4481_03785 [Patescibacteria group bacterium]